MVAPLLGIPLWAWVTGGTVAGAAGIGSYQTSRGAGEGLEAAGEGLGDGLRYGVPLALCATAIYLVMRK